uniref:Putative methyltransferase n=1 Tax=viral metagenome TaxID=1070528 RepID=A0A6M3XIM8_9ZZZZ
MDLMQATADNHYDLAIVDPPYGIERFKRGGSIVNKYGDENRHWNNIKPNLKYFAELRRVSKNQIIWGANNFELPTSEYFIIWKKSNALDFSFAMVEMAWTNIRKPAKIFEYLHVSNKDGRIHPTQKPVALYRWLLKNYAKAGQRILDTHGGSFSSAVACHTEGYEMDIIEIDEEYYNAGIKRFKEATCQLNLLAGL